MDASIDDYKAVLCNYIKIKDTLESGPSCKKAVLILGVNLLQCDTFLAALIQRLPLFWREATT